MKTDLRLLTSPGFVFAVALLLVNDFVLKAAFSNWFTGKLSDFAGLFAFALFWISLFWKRRAIVTQGIGLFFIWWKLAYSQPFIDWWNSIAPLRTGRVVDPTDLLALCVLPCAIFYASKEKRRLRLHPVSALIAGTFAFAATSVPPDSARIDKTYHFKFPKDTLEARLDRMSSRKGFHIYFMKADTSFVRISYPSGFCKDTQAEGQTWQRTDSTAALHISVIDYRGDTSRQSRYHLKQEFEKTVIRKLRED